jgi:hypothetical protein
MNLITLCRITTYLKPQHYLSETSESWLILM